MARQIGNGGLALIKRFEGYRGYSYRDPVGIWTIGYGETKGVKPGMYWSEEKAARVLRERVNRDFAPAVSAAAKRYKLDLDQDEFDALCSFVYNLGAGALTPGASVGSTMRGALESRNRRKIGRAFMAYVFAGGIRFLGLVRRRVAERKLFLTRTRRLKEWRKELAKIRRVVRLRFKGDWKKTPKRKARADELKRAIRAHIPNER